MATAFTFQMLVVSALVAVPLLSATIIPMVRPSIPVPVTYERPAADTHKQQATGGPSSGVRLPPTREIVTFNDGRHSLLTLRNQIQVDGPLDPAAKPCFDSHCFAGPTRPPGLLPVGPAIVPKRPDGPVRMSHMDEGLLINRVIPAYPAIAVRTGVQGEVQLHAIIARDGTIQSLTVISGHPFLIAPAMQAVQQWRYRPYVLDGEPVEVDTYITVNFKRSN
jgi:TonB family protein